jgi:hypothetical protein
VLARIDHAPFAALVRDTLDARLERLLEART